MGEEPIDYKKLYEDEQKKVAILENDLLAFKSPGKTKLYHAVNRNMSDLADLLNAKSIKNVNLDDKDDKTIERLKIIWSAIKSLSETLAVLRVAAGLSGDEEEENKTPFIETVAETRK